MIDQGRHLMNNSQVDSELLPACSNLNQGFKKIKEGFEPGGGISIIH